MIARPYFLGSQNIFIPNHKYYTSHTYCTLGTPGSIMGYWGSEGITGFYKKQSWQFTSIQACHCVLRREPFPTLTNVNVSECWTV